MPFEYVVCETGRESVVRLVVLYLLEEVAQRPVAARGGAAYLAQHFQRYLLDTLAEGQEDEPPQGRPGPSTGKVLT